LRLPRWLSARRSIQRERAEAEQKARDVQSELVLPLRAMRQQDFLTRAVQSEIRRQIIREDE